MYAQRSPGLRKRIALGVVLLAYLGFMIWTFFFSANVLEAQLWFVPISVLLWIVLRAFRKRAT